MWVSFVSDNFAPVWCNAQGDASAGNRNALIVGSNWNSDDAAAFQAARYNQLGAEELDIGDGCRNTVDIVGSCMQMNMLRPYGKAATARDFPCRVDAKHKTVTGDKVGDVPTLLQLS